MHARSQQPVRMVVPFAWVSRSHARMTPVGGKLQIEDLASVNGTFVNGVRLDGTRLLANHDVIGLGEVGPHLTYVDPDMTQSTVRASAVRRAGHAVFPVRIARGADAQSVPSTPLSPRPPRPGVYRANSSPRRSGVRTTRLAWTPRRWTAWSARCARRCDAPTRAAAWW